ncbi:MAG: YkvA family protein [Myxococcota bacterium]|nr:YkvA family protein [Myxococcota bacterium]
MATSMKISFSLDEADVAYFRKLLRGARKQAKDHEATETVTAVEELIERVRQAKKTPGFVKESVVVLEDLVKMLRDDDYQLPAKPREEVLAALAYFANPEDLIPDQIPGLGFLDDAIMMKIMENELKHELWGYRRFAKFRAGAEQRPWTSVARQRLPQRLVDYRKKVRADVDQRKKDRSFSWW